MVVGILRLLLQPKEQHPERFNTVGERKQFVKIIQSASNQKTNMLWREAGTSVAKIYYLKYPVFNKKLKGIQRNRKV